MKGQILFETGKVAEAIPQHAKAVELAPDQPLLRINLAQAMIAGSDSEQNREEGVKAQELLLTALAVDDTNPFAYNQLAITYARQGNDGMAALSTAEQHYHAGNIAGAETFAVRADHYLEKGTPAWHRASDIINAARNVRQDRRS